MNKQKPVVRLIGRDSNVFLLLGLCQRAATQAGWTIEEYDKFRTEAESSDYNHCLATIQKYFDVR